MKLFKNLQKQLSSPKVYQSSDYGEYDLRPMYLMIFLTVILGILIYYIPSRGTFFEWTGVFIWFMFIGGNVMFDKFKIHSPQFISDLVHAPLQSTKPVESVLTLESGDIMTYEIWRLGGFQVEGFNMGGGGKHGYAVTPKIFTFKTRYGVLAPGYGHLTSYANLPDEIRTKIISDVEFKNFDVRNPIFYMPLPPNLSRYIVNMYSGQNAEKGLVNLMRQAESSAKGEMQALQTMRTIEGQANSLQRYLRKGKNTKFISATEKEEEHYNE